MHQLVREVEHFWKVPFGVLNQEVQQGRLVLPVFGAHQLETKTKLNFVKTISNKDNQSFFVICIPNYFLCTYNEFENDTK